MPRNKKMAVLHLAQSVELAMKAALVEKNVPIYDKGNRTITVHTALESLAKIWNVERIDGHAKIELLVDERNAIQHRYGNVDEVTLDYHMQTAYDVLSNILSVEFDLELSDWIKDNLDAEVWQRVRFVAGEEGEDVAPSQAIVVNRSPVLDLVDGFSRYEKSVKGHLFTATGNATSKVSTLDFMLKMLCNAERPDTALIKNLPDAYRLRNRVIHGDEQATIEDVKSALTVLDDALKAVSNTPNELILRAAEASQRGDKGTRLEQPQDISALEITT